jgi:hypothetical protein
VVAEHVQELRRTPFAELLARASTGPEVEQLRGPSGERLLRRTTVQRHVRGGQEELWVTVQVLRESRFGRLDPLAEQAVHVPSDEPTGEHLLAGDGGWSGAP